MAKVKKRNIEDLEAELQEMRHRLFEASETIEAIRLGQVDALVVEGDSGNQLYTLRTADQVYRIFIEKMAEGAVTLGREGLILFCNIQFASMLRLSLPDVVGKPFKDFVPGEYLAEFENIFHQSWTADHKQELQLYSGDGIIPVQMALSSLSLENETLLSVIVTDLTQQKAAQFQLEMANRLLGDTNKALENSNHDLQQFASVASHDLQEPLRKMQTLLSYILDKEADKLSDRTSRQMVRVMQAATRMRSFVVDVLNYSRLSSDDHPFTRVSLDEVVNEVLEDLDLMIQDKAAIIELGSLCLVQANKGRLRQVIQNLILNALKFSKPGKPPKIRIDGKYLTSRSFEAARAGDGPFFLMRIKDEGIGFDEVYAERIFSLFARLHSKDQYEGNGIGLAIAKRIVEEHGGLITARSRKDEGAEFLVLLPVSQQRMTSIFS